MSSCSKTIKTESKEASVGTPKITPENRFLGFGGRRAESDPRQHPRRVRPLKATGDPHPPLDAPDVFGSAEPRNPRKLERITTGGYTAEKYRG